MPEPRFTSFAIAATDRTLPVPQRASESIFAAPKRRQSIGEEARTSLLPRAKSGQRGVGLAQPLQVRRKARHQPPLHQRRRRADLGRDKPGAAGANYGWPAYEGPESDSKYTPPLYAYGHGGTDTTGCAITGDLLQPRDGPVPEAVRR